MMHLINETIDATSLATIRPSIFTRGEGGLVRKFQVSNPDQGQRAELGGLTPKAIGIKKSTQVAEALLWPTSPTGSTGTLKCAPKPPPGKINLRRTGPLTAPPRPAKGPPKGKVQGSL